jgi:CDP-glucose 4,6-dehydratase
MQVKLLGKFGMDKFSFFKEKKVLVTGSSGLLGSWLIEELINNDALVTGVSIDDSKDELLINKGIINNIDTHYVNISDFDEIENIMSSADFDIVFHLAAQTQVIEARENPLETLKSNVQGTWNVLENCRRLNLPLVCASSDKAYGVSENLPYLESHPLSGEFPYEVSKSSSDLITTMYQTTYGLKVATLRCGNIFGGGDFNWDRLIPGIIKTLIENDIPVLRTQGDFIREWVYVKDVVNAYLKVGKAVVQERNNFVAYNFSSGDIKNVMEIYELISIILKGDIVKPKILLDSEFEIKNQRLDSSLIKSDLNISSKFNLNESLNETIAWYKKYLSN